MNALKIFKSSAGSGKTFILVKEYLRLVLGHPEDFQHILAITFTNKAAAEMKSRIIEALVQLSKGEHGALHDVLTAELPELNLKLQAEKALKLILHNYSAFSVSTIDSFFQRILRALAREMHLPLRLEVEIGLEDAIIEVTDNLLKEVGTDKELTEWLGELIFQKLDEDKGWNVEADIHLVANELFKDHYEDAPALSRERIREIYNELKKIRKNFEKSMHDCGTQAVRIMEDAGLETADFSHGSGGVMGNLEKLKDAYTPDEFRLKARALGALNDPTKWATKTSERKEQILTAVSNGLGDCLQKAFSIVENGFKDYLSACEALRRIYMFGIANDILKKFSEYRNENNVILLADTPKMLSEIITGQDAPFIYEKAGNRFKHLLIDEFQDTSLYQWKNLLPLINNTLGSGNMALVVGDAKQSIYRWRGGNMNLLLVHILEDLNHFRELYQEQVLSTNFRSRSDIVDFNNSIFKIMPKLIRDNVHPDGHKLLDLAYAPDLVQEVATKNQKEGYVKISFLESIKDEDQEDEKTDWKEIALRKMHENIESLLNQNYSFRDIAILVRRNIEGNEIANFLLEKGITQIISPDSLLIAQTPRIKFLVNLMRFLSNTQDQIARTEVIYYYNRYLSNHSNPELHPVFSDHLKQQRRLGKKVKPTLFEVEEFNDTLFNKMLPEEFTSSLSYLSKLPIYDLSEQLISIFGFNKSPDAYIQRFQDLVLEYTAKNNSSLDGFLDWWNQSKTVRDCSVLIPENENAIRILTIHKSKGLQFPVVIMPFAEWKIMPRSNELFWGHADPEPYNEMGRVALVSSKNLMETHFSEAYHEEIMQTLIDNLNMLYVAFTRAEEQLFIYTPIYSGKKFTTVASLLQKILQENNLTIENDIYQRGNAGLMHEKNKSNEAITSEKLTSYTSNKWQNKIGISSRATDLLQITGEKVREKINYGILIHRVLSEVLVIDDIEKAVNKILFEGMLAEVEKDKLITEINELVSQPEIANFFSSEWEVKNEREIILPEGEIIRPDRVLIGPDKTLVIDFKTGKESKSHETQIKKYATVLSEMNYPNVQSILVYIQSREVKKL